MKIPDAMYGMSLLTRMEKAGIIKLHENTQVFGYINDGPHEFDFEHTVYNVKYFDGCFYPFVVWNREKTRAKYS
jgi:hypothetical protein